MSELNLQTHQLTAIGTNAEFILPEVEKKQPPVLKSVAKAIIVETIKDFFRSIIGFFLRYIKHTIQCLVYFISPSLKRKPFDQLNYKGHAQHTFEFLIILMALVFFMEKVSWIPQTSADLIALYGDDRWQKLFEIFFFLVFALLYLAVAALTIYTGRFFCKIFRISLSKDESDILFNYLNNAFFSLATIFAFGLRCAASVNTHDEESISQFIVMCTLPFILIATSIWSVRFAIVHRVSWGRSIGFVPTVVIFYTILFFTSSLVLTATLLGI